MNEELAKKVIRCVLRKCRACQKDASDGESEALASAVRECYELLRERVDKYEYNAELLVCELLRSQRFSQHEMREALLAGRWLTFRA